MNNSIRVSVLAAAIGFCLAGGSVDVGAAPATKSQPPQGTATYLVRFAEAGVLEYQGGLNGLRATAPTDARRRFDAHSADVIAYRQMLGQFQAGHRNAIAGLLGREIEVTHTYELTQSGMAIRLTPSEAAMVAQLNGVAAVEVSIDYTTDTYRGPSFINAPAVWNSGGPGNPLNSGKGIVVGVLDSGSFAAHPSFADDPACGFNVTDHKLLSTRDCSSTAAGVCNGPTPEAVASGHGVHTASTAAGNAVLNSASPSPNVPAPYSQISGVAPCASVRTYKVCNNADGTCSSADIIAAMNNAILDAVDVINFSISGGTSPWTDNDRTFLDVVNAGIFVAASAGNTNATITNPVGQVNHRSPWVTTVAASTHDKALGPGLSATGPGVPPTLTVGIISTPGSNTPTPVPFTDQPIRIHAANAVGCTATNGFPAGTFTGSIALIPRGGCTFVEKVTNASGAGAQQVIVFNNVAGSINMNTDGAPIPAYSISQVQGEAMRDFIVANSATPTTATLVASSAGNAQGDVLANFSLRGPTPAPLADLTKPDITGPGVNIYAAFHAAGGNYGLSSGTSMSSPHLAGAGALVIALHPNWTPMEVKSALMMTAAAAGTQENGTTPWNADDVGSGRVDLSKAPFAGLVMNESFANMLAANPDGGSIDVKALNLPAVRNLSCSVSCSWTRTVRSTLAASADWNVTVAAPTGFALSVSPASFTVAAGATQTLTITATVLPGETGTTTRFGAITLAPVVPADSPDLHITTATKRAADPIFSNGFE